MASPFGRPLSIPIRKTLQKAVSGSQVKGARARPLTRKPADGSLQTYGPGLSWHTALSQEAAFRQVRCVFVNGSTTTPYDITIAKAAPSAKLSGVAALDASDGAVPWVNLTFNGLASVTVPVATGSGAEIVPGIVWSDWIDIASLARADEGTYPLLLVRAYAANAMNGLHRGNPAIANYVAAGRELASLYQAGDRVTSPLTMTSPTTSTAQIHLYAVQTRPTVLSRTIAGFGDSLFQGYSNDNTTDFNGWINRAAKLLSTSQKPVSAINCGYAGRTTAGTLANFLAFIDAFSPDIVCIPVYSPNDGVLNQTIADTAWSRAMTMVSAAQSRGIKPVLVTPAPWNLSDAPEAVRVAQVTKTRNYGLPYIDMELALSDGASPARVQSNLVASDLIHPNVTLGQDAMATAATSALSPLL